MLSPAPRNIGEAAGALRQRRYTCRDLVLHYLEGLEELQPVLRVLISPNADAALARADELDTELRRGNDRGPLHGIPYCNKDIFAARGLPLTVGSPLFRQRIATEDAAVVARLDRAGAILLGQTNMSEFAATPSGRNRAYGDVRNPWREGRTPGTSSSGSAAALAAGLCLGATGSDTSNSIRSPAGYCGVVGLRPTPGLVSLHGAFPRAASLDSPGPMARTARDAALLLNAMAGYDPRDARSLKKPDEDYTRNLGPSAAGLNVALVTDFSLKDVDPEVAAAVLRAADALRARGARLLSLSVPLLEHGLDPEALFDILSYEFNEIITPIYEATANKNLFDPAVLENIRRGRSVPQTRYQNALEARKALCATMQRSFGVADLLITPTTPDPAPTYDQAENGWERQRRFLIPVSYLGLPGLAVPGGISAEGLPLGIQLIGKPLEEAKLFQAAVALEQAELFSEKPGIFWG